MASTGRPSAVARRTAAVIRCRRGPADRAGQEARTRWPPRPPAARAPARDRSAPTRRCRTSRGGRRSSARYVLVVTRDVDRLVPRLEGAGVEHEVEQLAARPAVGSSLARSEPGPDRRRRAGRAAGGAAWSRRVTSAPSASKKRSGGPGSVTVPSVGCSTSTQQSLAERSGPTRRPRRGCGPCRPARRPRPAGPAAARRPSRRTPPRPPRSPGRARATRSALVARPSASGSSSKPAQNRRHSPSLPSAICTAPSRQWKRP